MGKIIGFIIGLFFIIIIGMFVLLIALWILNLLLFLLKWISLVAISGFLIMAIRNFFKVKKDKTVRHFSHFLYLALAALLVFGVTNYSQPKLHTYLTTNEDAELQQEEKKVEVVETPDKVAEKINADWSAQAVKMAENYLDYSAFSRSGLIEQLIFEGFSNADASNAADAVGL